MLEELRKQVYEANMELPRRNLVTYTWGNVSGIDREKGLVVIKPSGVGYDELTPENLVVLDLDGNRVEGELNPSSDTKTHLELYKAFPTLGGIVHTHSPYAVAWPRPGGHSLLRHHPRRLLLRCRALCPPPDQGGAGRGPAQAGCSRFHAFCEREEDQGRREGVRPGHGIAFQAQGRRRGAVRRGRAADRRQ